MTTIIIDRAVVEQALEILEKLVVGSDYEEAVEAERAMESFRAALAQQAEPVASRGWLFRRNADGTIGIFAPPPKPGEFQRTSDCVGPNNRDLHELLGKLADHMAAPPQQAEPDAYGYASRVAVSIWQWNYKDTAPNWKPLDDLMGVLTQIDNMTSGLTRRAQQAEPVEPVAEARYDGTLRWLEPHGVGLHRIQGPLYIIPPQRKPLTEEEIERICMTYQSPRQAARAVERAHGITDPQIEDRLARHGIPMPGGPK